MRISKSWIPCMAKKVVSGLVGGEFIETPTCIMSLIKETEWLILRELTEENRLDNEIHQLLRRYQPEITKEKADYRRLFLLTKRRLIEERDIVL